MDTTTAIRVDELEVGDRILYPHEQRNTAPIDKPVTVTRIIEYPATRVLYFTEGGYGVADRHVTFELAPRPLLEVLADHVAGVQAARA